MPKRRPHLALLALATLLGSCAAGPHQLRRSLDDWDHKLYVNSPLLSGAMWIVPVFPAGYAIAFAGDFLIGDAWHFWFHDLWDGEGTGFEHLQVEAPDGAVQSFLIDRSGWTRVDK